MRSPKRRYRMRRRAEQMDQTRARITEAAVKLHTSIGPAHTTIAGVAEEAGVTRLTVYRHFEDQDALFEACMGHWNAANPAPDLEGWTAVEPLEARARRAFAELFDWFGARHEQLYPIYRDHAAMPESARQALAAQNEAIASAIVAPEPGSVRAAVARHLSDFWTWRSLVVEQGLTPAEATEAAVAMLLAVRAD